MVILEARALHWGLKIINFQKKKLLETDSISLFYGCFSRFLRQI